MTIFIQRQTKQSLTVIVIVQVEYSQSLLKSGYLIAVWCWGGVKALRGPIPHPDHGRLTSG